MAAKALVIPMIQTGFENMAAFLEPDSGHASLLPAVCMMVKKLQEGIEFCFQPLTQQKGYMLANICASKAGSLSRPTNSIAGKISSSGMLSACKPRMAHWGDLKRWV